MHNAMSCLMAALLNKDSMPTQDGDRLYIYLEYVHPGSINKYIQDHCGVITESVVRSFTRHIVCGLAYLHSTKTIHRLVTFCL